MAMSVSIALTALLPACVRTREGAPVAPNPAAAAAPSTRAIPTPQTELSEPGVVPTEKTQIPATGRACPPADRPPVSAVAAVADPSAPKITVALPTGWGVAKGDGDVGARLTGPNATSATVTIAATTLDPAAAFKQYADEVMAASAISSLSVLPAQLCGYSGQKLLGAWGGGAQTVEFGDRLVHVWTDTTNYLVVVHVQGPADAPDFDPFSSPLLGDVGIEIP